MFSSDFLQILIVVSLAWTALGAIILLALLVKDWVKGTLW